MISQSFKIAFSMLMLHKARAVLTMLGVIIGVMAVTIIVMISNGFQSYLTKQFSGLGANSIYIVWAPPGRGRGQTQGALDGLKVEDAQFIAAHTTKLKALSPLAQTQAEKVVNGDKEVNNLRIYGQDEKFDYITGTEVGQGRDLVKGDVDSVSNVCLVGEEIRDKLFGKQNPIGQYVQLPQITLQVVGVLKKKDMFGQTNGRDIRMPISTMQHKVTGSNKLQMIATEAAPGVPTTVALDDAWQALMLMSHNKQLYRVDSNESIVKTFTGVLAAAGLLLAAIAALSLLVGGIGIMNIMLVSVTERTKEIGLRMALGAKRKAILTQFLIESGTLSLVGGLIGMGIAYGFGLLIHFITLAKKWPAEGGLDSPFPPSAALMAAGISFVIGVIFGLFPAMNAAKLDPIVALRTE